MKTRVIEKGKLIEVELMTLNDAYKFLSDKVHNILCFVTSPETGENVGYKVMWKSDDERLADNGLIYIAK